jgi:hypothetical protein
VTTGFLLARRYVFLMETIQAREKDVHDARQTLERMETSLNDMREELKKVKTELKNERWEA